jgi:hypothetical protein
MELEPLDLFNDVPPAFPNTMQWEGHIFLCKGLDKMDDYRPVLKPMSPDAYTDWSSDENSSSEEEMFADTFHYFDSVGEIFGPQGGDTRLDYMVNKEVATEPDLREMTIITDQGGRIVIRPRFKPRKRLTRGCVELAISEWMREQRGLQWDDPRKHDVRSFNVPIKVDGEVKQVAVWMWRGLEQDRDNPNVFRIFL